MVPVGPTALSLRGAVADAGGMVQQQVSDGTDRRTRADVLAAICWVLRDADDVTVEVRGGVVRLSGRIPSIEDRERVVTAAFGVSGASVVVDELTITGVGGAPASDPAIALAARDLLQSLSSIGAETVRCRVRRGVVTVAGPIGWHFERDTILNLMAAVPGVQDVVDAMAVQHGGTGTSVHAPRMR